MPDPEPVPEPKPEPVPQPVPIASVPDRARAEEERAAERKRRREAWFKTTADAREALAVKQADYRKRRQLLNENDQRLKDLQDQILKSQLKSASVEKADQSLAAAADRLEEQQERVAQEIARTRKSIDVLNRRQAAAKNEYSLVPYDGTSGTVRRPVYIECTGRGFRFLPEDETVSPTDLEGFSDNYNPLLAGAQSLVRFWARRRRNSPESEPEPYVLLLVRPSGCFTYYLARKYLSSLNVNFGYELIEEDWKLSVPDPDPVAKSLLKETLDTTVQAGQPSHNLFADAGRGYGDAFGGDEFGRGGRSNHFGPSDDDDDSGGFGGGNGSGPRKGRKPSIKFGPATRASRNAPGGSDDDPPAGTGGSAGTAKRTVAAAGANSAGIGGSAAGTGRGGSRAAGIGGGSRTGSVSGDGASNPEMDSKPAIAVSRSRPGDSGDAGDGPGNGTADSNDQGGPFGGARRGGRSGRGGSRAATLGGSSLDLDGDGGSGNGDDPLELFPPESPARLSGRDGTGGPGGSGFDPDLQPVSPNSRKSLNVNPFDSSGGTPVAGDGSTSRGSRSRSSSGSPSPSGSTTANSNESDATGSEGLSSADLATASASGDGSPSNVQFGGPGANFSLGGRKQARRKPKDDDPDAGPRISDDNGKSGGQLGRSNGPRKWGQAGKKASIGQERTIEIRLLSDQILVGSRDIAIPVRGAESSDEIVQRVINGIDHVAENWGEPREHFYWVPFVRFVVYPGGDQYYEKLSKVLQQKYGVNSSVDYPDDKPARKPADKPTKKPAPRGRP